MDLPITVNNPSDLPDPSTLDRVEEPFIKATIITKADYVGNVMSLCIDKRGLIKNQTYLTTQRVELTFVIIVALINGSSTLSRVEGSGRSEGLLTVTGKSMFFLVYAKYETLGTVVITVIPNSLSSLS